jgi:lipid A 3-O-deacylase
MKETFSLFVLVMVALAAVHTARAESPEPVPTVEPVNLRELAKVEYSFSPATLGELQDAEPGDADAFSTARRHQPFGRADTKRLQVHGAWGRDIKTSDNQFGLIGAGISYFIIENLSLDFELNGMYVEQRGSDAWAGNVNLLFRWHFLSEETWSLYVDGGAGFFFATKRVPSDGTHLNFTPQAGVGVSFEIAPDLRMMVGLRWHHISNARLSRNNPGRDHVMAYVGLSMPF